MPDTPSMPDFPKEMVTAVVAAIIGLLVSFGVDVSDEKQQAITTAAIVLPSAFLLAMAYVRGQRAKYHAARVQAAAYAGAQSVLDTPPTADGDNTLADRKGA